MSAFARRGWIAALVAGVVLVLPAAVRQTPSSGSIAGRVVDAASGQALAGAQVVVVGTRYGDVTDRDGRYRIDGVPSGTHELQAQLLGYEVLTQAAVRVRTGQTTTVDFRMHAAAVVLEAIEVGRDRAERHITAPGLPQASYDLSSKAAAGADPLAHLRARSAPWNTEAYDGFEDNPFLGARANPLSTFAIDVDRASYANVRRFIEAGQRPPKDAVRIEELVNYFRYDYPEPAGAHPFSISTEVVAAPWRPQHRLVRIGLQAERIDMSDLPPNNLVFLLDVSGSMTPANKLPLVKQSMRMLVEQLRPQDRVAIVVYAGAAGLVLPSTPGNDRTRILAAIDMLEAGGSTAGGAGIRLAYDVARQHHIAGGNNRVILATDGDFNVGVSSDAEMVRLIEEKRRQGTFLTVLGFGMGNYKDSKLEKLADHGNGNYAYIDRLDEARKVLIEEAGGTLLALAKDVKIQVEFNPARVRAYRLIGYENRLLAAEDFDDDTKDAGEIGAGHSVTALYEVVPVGVEGTVEVREPASLRYTDDAARTSAAASDELLLVKLRYKDPDGDASRLLEVPVRDAVSQPGTDLRFAAAVAAFGMILRESEHSGDATLARVAEWARAGLGRDVGGHRRGFLDLVGRARELNLDDPAVAARED